MKRGVRLGVWLMTLALGVRCNTFSAASELNAGSDALTAGRNEEALQHYDKAIAIEPKFGSAHCMRGSALLKLKRFGEAVEAFKVCVSLDSKDHDAKASLAEALARSCKYAEARSALDALDAANTQDPRVRQNGEWVRTRLAKADALGGRCLPSEEWQ